MKKLLLSTVAVLGLAACSSASSDMLRLETKIATPQAIEHHNYELIYVNGKEFEAEDDDAPRPFIAFGENMNITGTMCNNFFGQGILTKRGILSAKGAGMTRMMCTDPILNQLDTDISTLLEHGAEAVISDNGEYLKLSNTAIQLEFKRADKMR